MIDHFLFIFFIFLFLFSTIGYGIIFSNLLYKDFLTRNIGYLGLVGFFAMSLYSGITSFFFPHNELHNIIIHFFGISSATFFLIRYKKNEEFVNLIKLVSILIIATYLYKNHDDFPYYHLTYSLNLSENGFIIGSGIFSHGFRTFSSLFYYNSLLYLPLIKFYLFHIGPFYILVFFSFIILHRLKQDYENKFQFNYYFSLLSFIFVLVVFYRLAEHGTDRSAQILLLLVFIIFSEIILSKEKKVPITEINFLILLIFLASSMKAIYYMYFVIVPIILFNQKFITKFFTKKNILFLITLSFSFIINILVSFFSTGCLLYPASFTCIGNFAWSLPIYEVNKMNIHYEWWAKAGGGPGYSSEIPKEKYIEGFIWFENWVQRHFFNKISDTLLGILFICFLLTIVIYFFSEKNKKKIESNLTLYLIPLIFLIVWFLNHPSMRYGGYVLFAIPIFILTSFFLSSYRVKNERLKLIGGIFIILTIIIFNTRNITRLYKEFNFYGYNIAESPYYYVQKVEAIRIFKSSEIEIFSPPKNTKCWATKTPCSHLKEIKLSKFLWMNVVTRN